MTIARLFAATLAFALLSGDAGAESVKIEGIQSLESAAVSDEDDVTALFYPLKVTGSALPMEQVFSVADLRQLAEYGLDGLCVRASYQADGAEHTGYGLDAWRFLELCGAEWKDGDRLTVIGDEGQIVAEVDPNAPGVILLSVDGEPVREGASIVLGGEEAICASGLRTLMLGSKENPHYETHNRPPHDQSAGIEFTFNVYTGGALERSVILTTAELERIALENPEAVYGSWYGVIGNHESIPTMGAGAFLDYYEGVRFDFLLNEVLGLSGETGFAELYGREGEQYARIDDIGYFSQPAESFYMCTDAGSTVSGLALPILAYSKNGSPLLPEHEHDSEAYVRSAAIRLNMEEMGVETNVGTVKNHSGPFVAALGNCDGYFGGYQVETGGDCVRMDIHLN